MDELESQIAKIVLGNTKTSNTYVYAMAEKASAGNEELYVVAELPVFNPAAQESCERICLAISSGLKRAYKRPANENTFEAAINQINEELGKLASMGQTQWIDKLNCILGVRHGQNFSIATCGKVSAYLLRNSEYTDISCSQTQSHPLKTFENYATGKIRLGDLLVLSTIQLFNHLSMDRLLKIVSGSDFLAATQTVIQLLKDAADPQISFGVLLNLQVPVGHTSDQEVDLENYVVESYSGGKNVWASAVAYLKTAFALDHGKKRQSKADLPRPIPGNYSNNQNGSNDSNFSSNQPGAKTGRGLPKISFGERFKGLSGKATSLKAAGFSFWQMAKTGARSVKEIASPAKFRQQTPQKKFFLISIGILLLSVIFSLGVAVHLRNTKTTSAKITSQITAVQGLLQNAQDALLYKNDSQAADFLEQAKSKLPNEKDVDSGNKDQYNKALAQLNDAVTQMQKVITPEVSNLGSLGQGENLIKLPNLLANQAGQVLLSFNKQNSKIEDSALNLPASALGSAFTSGNNAAVYDGSQLYMWDFSAGSVSSGFSQSVPQKDAFGGMAYYPTNSRVYVVDKKSASILNFAAGSSGFSRPITAVEDASLSSAVDMTIDGNIYVLTATGVSKFLSGRLTDFALPKLPTPLSGKGKIYTQKDFVNLYILDSGNNRILVFDKKGSLVMTLQSDKFTAVKDFAVDEKGKVIYVLNDGSLLKVILPQ